MGSTIAGCDRLFHQVKGLTETPHVRGEDLAPVELTLSVGETPPRTWGRPLRMSVSQQSPRNTPTYVGKTTGSCPEGLPAEKHPHVRGEDLPTASSKLMNKRNTPTYVGKTRTSRKVEPSSEKHPHVRGEDLEILLNFFLSIHQFSRKI